jgi:DNA invertase Pin-like site-specific DNA recombinase
MEGLKLAAYVRVSTETQAREGLGLDVQRAAIEEWCQDNRHAVLSWHEDVRSGRNGGDDRPALAEALAAVQDGTVGGLVLYNLDRLARTLHVQEAVLGQVWASGAKVFTVEDGEVPEDDPTDPYRTAMRQMRGVFSQLERAVIRARMEAGRRAAVAEGRRGQGAAPYGYVADGHGGLVPERREQEVLAKMAALRASGASLSEIARALNAEHIGPKRGEAWHPSTVRRALARFRGQSSE